METLNYKKITVNHPMYKMLQKAKKHGLWVCDSADHNEDSGCSNPDCFKFNKTDKA